jgi:diamine N-acetyltransferase
MNTLQLIHRLKKESQSPQNHIKIESIRNINACLRPVQTTREDARVMAKWRRETYQSFFTWIQPSEAEMLEWLTCYENIDSDILFFIEAPVGNPVGQVSIYNVDMDKKLAEFGRIIKGEKECPENLMNHACATVLQWAFYSLQLKKISLEVFADNKAAISLYKKLRFNILDILLFSKTKTPKGIICWINVEKARDKNQYRMVYKMTVEPRNEMNENGSPIRSDMM